MSSSSYASTVDLALRPSMRAHHLLFWTHAGSLLLLTLAMEPGIAMMLIAAGIALSWVWLRRHPAFGHGPRALTRVTWHTDGRWSIQQDRGPLLDAELLGDSYRQSALLILNFRTTDGRRRTRILFGDEAPPDPLRRLRARLQAWTAETSQP